MNGQRTNDPVLGPLRWDAELETYRATVVIAGADVEVDISADGSDEDAVFACIRELVPLLPSIATRAAEHASKELLELKNGTWRADDEAPLTHEQFVARLVLRSFAVYDDSGDLQIWFDDGDLFFGHAISVERSADGAFADASVQG